MSTLFLWFPSSRDPKWQSKEDSFSESSLSLSCPYVTVKCVSIVLDGQAQSEQL